MRGRARKALMAALLVSLAGDHAFRPSNDPARTAIVVFTGERNRVDEGLRLYREGQGRYLFITGIDLAAAPPQPRDAKRMFLDPGAVNTGENGIATRTWLRTRARNVDRIILVTSGYHMRRSLAVLNSELAGLPVAVEPHAVTGSLPAPAQYWEYAKTLATWIGITRIPGVQLKV